MQLEFSPLKESDLPILTDWLNLPHLQKWWKKGKITKEMVQQKYLPRILDENCAKPFIAYLGNIPTGYIQYYTVSGGESNWWPDNPGPGVLGIDVFLANPDQLNKGIGTRMISQFVEFLFRDPKIQEIRIDPQPDNLRAIRCYEKVGFKKVGPITNPDGPALMMKVDRSLFFKR